MKTLLFFLATLPIAACETTMSVQPNVSTTSGNTQPVSADRAAQNIATARCSRELSCGNIGMDGMNDCIHDVRDVSRPLLTACPRGIAPGYLSSCLESVRNEACGSVVTLPERLGSTCREAKLCL